MRRRQSGFSLIELLVVVAIIMIIASIAIPNLIRSKIAANEASAVSCMRTLNTASVAFSTQFGSYPTKLADLGPSNGATPSSTQADLVDVILGRDPATKSGYTFVYVATPSTNTTSYSITVTPLALGTTGQRGFFTNQTGVIRADSTGAATSSSTPLN